MTKKPRVSVFGWNELHVQGFENQSGTAAIARADIKLADLGTIQLAGKWTTFGFGGGSTKLAVTACDNTTEFSLSSALSLMFLPQQWGFKIPVYVNYDLREVRPHFNPYDPDTPLVTSLANYAENDARRMQLENSAVGKNGTTGYQLLKRPKDKSRAECQTASLGH